MSDYLFLKLDNITSCNSAFLRKDFGLRLRYAHSPEIIEGLLLKCMQSYYKNAGIYLARSHFFENNARFACVCAFFVVILHPILKEDRFGLLGTSIKEC